MYLGPHHHREAPLRLWKQQAHFDIGWGRTKRWVGSARKPSPWMGGRDSGAEEPSWGRGRKQAWLKPCCERPRTRQARPGDLSSDPTRNPFLCLHQLWEADDENLGVTWGKEEGDTGGGKAHVKWVLEEMVRNIWNISKGPWETRLPPAVPKKG